MKNTIGLGMFTVQNSAKRDLQKTLYELAIIGYKGVEFYGEPSDYPAGDVLDALNTSGLAITGWHMEWKNLHRKTIADTIRYLHKVKCNTAVIPCLGGKWNVGHDSSLEGKDIWFNYIEQMNERYHILKAEGIRLGYHNHEHEFQLVYDGKTVFDLLFDNLNPAIVMELDSGNCMEGGGNPIDVLQRYKNRPIILHAKPFSHRYGFNVTLGEKDDNDWIGMLHSLEVSYEWLLIESENEHLSELENARRCYENLERIVNHESNRV